MSQVLPECQLPLPDDVAGLLARCPRYTLVKTTEELVDLACKAQTGGFQEVAYDIPGHGRTVEARVCRVKNGIAANYPDPYMRRRDADCLFIGDSLPTNKPRLQERFGHDFARLRQETFDWLAAQELVLFPFKAGGSSKGVDALVVAPANAGFFALGLGMLQQFLEADDQPETFEPRAIIYVAPPFRHTHFKGRQVVVHNRTADVHEVFSYNLYPGPSAKKGVYGVLINIGEREQWITMHCSTVQVVTPYDNKLVISHEGASGGGKSEMLEHVHRERDGRLLLGRNIVTGEERHITIPRTCDLRPVTDDMALCHPSFQKPNGKLTVSDAEEAWFVRVDHIRGYGTDAALEEITVKPKKPLLFLNIDAVPGSTALIWDHIEDSPGKPCPNPRVILPRSIVPGVISGPVSVDIRSFGVRTPPARCRTPATASWASSTCSRPPWPGSGGWSARAATQTPASPVPMKA